MAQDPQWVNSKINWRSRIVKYGKIRADQVVPHPLNPRKHPIKQRQTVQASFDALGQIAPIMINVRNNYLIDGEERTWLALAQGDATELDAVWVDLTEDEHALALTIFDRITNMAYYDKDNLDDLMHQIDTDNAALQSLLSEMAEDIGIIPPSGDDWENAFDGLPTEDRALFQQMTFTLHDSQVETVKRAISHANGAGGYDSANENGNGNALARICEAYLNGR
jgi:hypothetical protein